MPNYDYFCLCCSKTLTRLVDLDKRDRQDCEICYTKLDRVISWKGAMKFKGTGFYKTDYEDVR